MQTALFKRPVWPLPAAPGAPCRAASARATDVFARSMGQRLPERWGRNMVATPAPEIANIANTAKWARVVKASNARID